MLKSGHHSIGLPHAVTLVDWRKRARPAVYFAAIYFSLIIAMLLNYEVNRLIAKSLGPVQFGNYSVAVFSAAFVASLILFGADASLFYSLPMLFREGEPDKAAGVLHIFIARKARLMLPLLLIVAALVLCDETVGRFLALPSLPQALLLVVLVPVMVLSALFFNAVRASGRTLLPVIAGAVLITLLQLLFYKSFIALYHRYPDMLLVLLVYVLSYGFFLLVCCLLAGWRFVRAALFTEGAAATLAPNWHTLARNLFLCILFINYYDVAALDMLKILPGEAVLVGHLAAIITIGNFLWLPFSSLSLYFAPKINALLQEDKAVLQKQVRLINYLNGGATLLLVIALSVLARPMLLSFGHSYSDSYPALMILIWLFVPVAFFSSNFTLLEYGGQTKLLVKASCVFFVLILAVSAFMAIFFSLAGIAAAIDVLLLLYFALLGYFVRRRLGVNPL